MLFSELYKIMVNKVTSVGFRGGYHHNEVRWRPGQETSVARPCLNLSSFGSKFTLWKKVLLTFLGLYGVPAVIRRPP